MVEREVEMDRYVAVPVEYDENGPISWKIRDMVAEKDYGDVWFKSEATAEQAAKSLNFHDVPKGRVYYR